MKKKYITIQNIISRDLVNSINELNYDKDTGELIPVKNTTQAFTKISENSDVLVPIHIDKGLNGNYHINEKYDLLKYDSFSSKNISFYFSLSYEDQHLNINVLNKFLNIENNLDKFLPNTELGTFNEMLSKCELTQISLLENFANTILTEQDTGKFFDIFLNLTNSGNLNPNYQNLLLEKLDKIEQELVEIRTTPFYLRNHSITFRSLAPILKITKKIKHKVVRLKNLAINRIKNRGNASGIEVSFNESLNKFFNITRKKINPKSINICSDENPELSIIIPVYGKLDFLARCLHSIQIANSNIKYEVIIVDDCGPEKVEKKFFEKNNGIRIHVNKENLGFTKTCNQGAKLAKGKFLCFLNSDTIVTDYWCDKLLDTFEAAESVGVVGSKLLYSDGSLQEAGGKVYSDGSAGNIGKYNSPDESWFKYTKEVDYVSGAALAIHKDDFNSINGFDDRFSPAYYEDTSLCLDVRHKLNKKVFVNPSSLVIHHEGATNGTDETKGIKRYMTINQSKFIEKHFTDLENYEDADTNEFWNIPDSYINGNVLIVDQCIPTPLEDSGSKDMDNILRALLDQKLRPHLFALSNRGMTKETIEYFEKGVHCIFGKSNINFETFYKKYHQLYDLIIISRVNSYDEVSNIIYKYTPHNKVIFYTVDLHHVRLETEYERTREADAFVQAKKTKALELKAIKQSSKSVVLSNKEREYLINSHGIPSNKLTIWPLIRSEFEKLEEYKKNDNPKDIIFIGGYRHTPNISAVKIIENEIVPELKKIFKENNIKFPGIKLYGSNPTEYINSLQTEDLKYMGFIENEADAFKNSALSIAPLPFGAGLKGKTLSSLIYKTPIVGSSYALEGFESIFPEVLINSSIDAKEFSKKIFTTYVNSSNINNWNEIISFLESKYSYQSFSKKIKKDIADLKL